MWTLTDFLCFFVHKLIPFLSAVCKPPQDWKSISCKFMHRLPRTPLNALPSVMKVALKSLTNAALKNTFAYVKFVCTSVVLGLVRAHISLGNKVSSFKWGIESTKTNTWQGQKQWLQKNKQTLRVVFRFVPNPQSTTLLFSTHTHAHTHTVIATRVHTDSSRCISYYGSNDDDPPLLFPLFQEKMFWRFFSQKCNRKVWWRHDPACFSKGVQRLKSPLLVFTNFTFHANL